jgi:hypothetical protein
MGSLASASFEYWEWSGVQKLLIPLAYLLLTIIGGYEESGKST